VERVLKTAPKGVVFCRVFTGTETYAVSIVAVHGDAMWTWTSDKNDICCLSHPDLLPNYVEGARILTWGYNANVASFQGRRHPRTEIYSTLIL
jgi:hypothetical protein